MENFINTLNELRSSGDNTINCFSLLTPILPVFLDSKPLNASVLRVLQTFISRKVISAPPTSSFIALYTSLLDDIAVGFFTSRISIQSMLLFVQTICLNQYNIISSRYTTVLCKILYFLLCRLSIDVGDCHQASTTTLSEDIAFSIIDLHHICRSYSSPVPDLSFLQSMLQSMSNDGDGQDNDRDHDKWRLLSSLAYKSSVLPLTDLLSVIIMIQSLITSLSSLHYECTSSSSSLLSSKSDKSTQDPSIESKSYECIQNYVLTPDIISFINSILSSHFVIPFYTYYMMLIAFNTGVTNSLLSNKTLKSSHIDIIQSISTAQLPRSIFSSLNDYVSLFILYNNDRNTIINSFNDFYDMISLYIIQLSHIYFSNNFYLTSIYTLIDKIMHLPSFNTYMLSDNTSFDSFHPHITPFYSALQVLGTLLIKSHLSLKVQSQENDSFYLADDTLSNSSKVILFDMMARLPTDGISDPTSYIVHCIESEMRMNRSRGDKQYSFTIKDPILSPSLNYCTSTSSDNHTNSDSSRPFSLYNINSVTYISHVSLLSSHMITSSTPTPYIISSLYVLTMICKCISTLQANKGNNTNNYRNYKGCMVVALLQPINHSNIVSTDTQTQQKRPLNGNQTISNSSSPPSSPSAEPGYKATIFPLSLLLWAWLSSVDERSTLSHRMIFSSFTHTIQFQLFLLSQLPLPLYNRNTWLFDTVSGKYITPDTGTIKSPPPSLSSTIQLLYKRDLVNDDVMGWILYPSLDTYKLLSIQSRFINNNTSSASTSTLRDFDFMQLLGPSSHHDTTPNNHGKIWKWYSSYQSSSSHHICPDHHSDDKNVINIDIIYILSLSFHLVLRTIHSHGSSPILMKESDDMSTSRMEIGDEKNKKLITNNHYDINNGNKDAQYQQQQQQKQQKQQQQQQKTPLSQDVAYQSSSSLYQTSPQQTSSLLLSPSSNIAKMIALSQDYPMYASAATISNSLQPSPSSPTLSSPSSLSLNDTSSSPLPLFSHIPPAISSQLPSIAPSLSKLFPSMYGGIITTSLESGNTNDRILALYTLMSLYSQASQWIISFFDHHQPSVTGCPSLKGCHSFSCSMDDTSMIPYYQTFSSSDNINILSYLLSLSYLFLSIHSLLLELISNHNTNISYIASIYLNRLLMSSSSASSLKHPSSPLQSSALSSPSSSSSLSSWIDFGQYLNLYNVINPVIYYTPILPHSSTLYTFPSWYTIPLQSTTNTNMSPQRDKHNEYVSLLDGSGHTTTILTFPSYGEQNDTKSSFHSILLSTLLSKTRNEPLIASLRHQLSASQISTTIQYIHAKIKPIYILYRSPHLSSLLIHIYTPLLLSMIRVSSSVQIRIMSLYYLSHIYIPSKYTFIHIINNIISHYTRCFYDVHDSTHLLWSSMMPSSQYTCINNIYLPLIDKYLSNPCEYIYPSNTILYKSEYEIQTAMPTTATATSSSSSTASSTASYTPPCCVVNLPSLYYTPPPSPSLDYSPSSSSTTIQAPLCSPFHHSPTVRSLRLLELYSALHCLHLLSINHKVWIYDTIDYFILPGISPPSQLDISSSIEMTTSPLSPQTQVIPNISTMSGASIESQLIDTNNRQKQLPFSLKHRESYTLAGTLSTSLQPQPLYLTNKEYNSAQLTQSRVIHPHTISSLMEDSSNGLSSSSSSSSSSNNNNNTGYHFICSKEEPMLLEFPSYIQINNTFNVSQYNIIPIYLPDDHFYRKYPHMENQLRRLLEPGSSNQQDGVDPLSTNTKLLTSNLRTHSITEFSKLCQAPCVLMSSSPLHYQSIPPYAHNITHFLSILMLFSAVSDELGRNLLYRTFSLHSSSPSSDADDMSMSDTTPQLSNDSNISNLLLQNIIFDMIPYEYRRSYHYYMCISTLPRSCKTSSSYDVATTNETSNISDSTSCDKNVPLIPFIPETDIITFHNKRNDSSHMLSNSLLFSIDIIPSTIRYADTLSYRDIIYLPTRSAMEYASSASSSSKSQIINTSSPSPSSLYRSAAFAPYYIFPSQYKYKSELQSLSRQYLSRIYDASSSSSSSSSLSIHSPLPPLPTLPMTLLPVNTSYIPISYSDITPLQFTCSIDIPSISSILSKYQSYNISLSYSSQCTWKHVLPLYYAKQQQNLNKNDNNNIDYSIKWKSPLGSSLSSPSSLDHGDHPSSIRDSNNMSPHSHILLSQFPFICTFNTSILPSYILSIISSTGLIIPTSSNPLSIAHQNSITPGAKIIQKGIIDATNAIFIPLEYSFTLSGTIYPLENGQNFSDLDSISFTHNVQNIIYVSLSK